MDSTSTVPTGTTTVVFNGQAHSAHYWAHCERNMPLWNEIPEVSVTVIFQQREKTRHLADQTPDRLAADLLGELLDAPRVRALSANH